MSQRGNGGDPRHRVRGDIWNVENARPLTSAIRTILDKACKRTAAITAHVSLVERPTLFLAPFTATGEGASIYNDPSCVVPQLVAKHVQEKRDILVLRDTHESPEWRETRELAVANRQDSYVELLDSYRSEIGIPLKDSEGKLTGVINLHHREVGGLTVESGKEIEAYTNAASTMLENAIRYECVRQRPDWYDSMVLESLGVVTAGKGGTDDGRGVCDLIVQNVLELSHADSAALWFLHEPTQSFLLAGLASCTKLLPEDEEGFVFRTPLIGIRGTVLEKKTAYYCPDTTRDVTWSGCLDGIQSCFTVPLTYEGQLLGVLCIDSYRTDAFDERMRDALLLQAHLYSFLLGSRFRQVRTRVDADHRTRLISIFGVHELCRRAVAEVPALIASESASLFLAEKDASGKTSFVLKATTGLAPGCDVDTTYSMNEGITGWVGTERCPLRLRDCSDPSELRHWDPKLKWSGKCPETTSKRRSGRPVIVIPVLDSKSECLGVLRASGKAGGLEFREEEKVALTRFAEALAVEIPRAQDAIPVSTAPGDRRAYLAEILRHVKKACGADAGTISIVDSGYLKAIAYEGALINPAAELSIPLERTTVSTHCYKWEQAQLVPNVHEDMWKDYYVECYKNIKSELAVPIVAGGKVFGVLNLESSRENFFTPEDQVRVQRFADVAAFYLSYQSGLRTEGSSANDASIAQALAAFRLDLPRLLNERPGEWVAYRGEKLLGIARSKKELYDVLLKKGVDRRELVLRQIDPINLGEEDVVSVSASL